MRICSGVIHNLLRTAPAPDDGPLARAAGDEVVRRGVVEQRPEALDIRLGPLVVERRRLCRLRQLDGEHDEGARFQMGRAGL